MWIINLIIGVFLLILGFCIKKFNMSYLISGYNTAPKEEKAKYNKNKLATYVGGMLMISSAILILGGLLAFVFSGYESSIYFTSNILFLAFIIFGLIYINTGKRIKK